MGQNRDFLIKTDAKNSRMWWTNIRTIFQMSNPQNISLSLKNRKQSVLLFLFIYYPRIARMKHSGLELQLLSRITKPNSCHVCDQMRQMQEATNHPQEQHTNTHSRKKIDIGGEGKHPRIVTSKQSSSMKFTHLIQLDLGIVNQQLFATLNFAIAHNK